MGTPTKYQNARTGRISSSGGAVRVTLSGGKGQGNGGDSLPCRGCFVTAINANSAVVRMNIDADATADLGIDLARNYVYDGTNEASAATANPLYVPIDDVSKLYFFSTDATADIDIIYLRG